MAAAGPLEAGSNPAWPWHLRPAPRGKWRAVGHGGIRFAVPLAAAISSNGSLAPFLYIRQGTRRKNLLKLEITKLEVRNHKAKLSAGANGSGPRNFHTKSSLRESSVLPAPAHLGCPAPPRRNMVPITSKFQTLPRFQRLADGSGQSL